MTDPLVLRGKDEAAPIGDAIVQPLRIAVIGAGELSSSRIFPCLHLLPVELVAVCDLNVERGAHIGRKYGNPAVFADYREMLDSCPIDALIVCVGPAIHRLVAIEAMERGIPVYTEKPPATSARGALEMLDASIRTGVICMTGFKRRFAPSYVRARNAILDPSFGAPTLVAIHHASGGGYVPGSADERDNFLLDFGIHAIDLARYLGGEVGAVTVRESGDVAYGILLEYQNGAIGTISLSANRSWKVGSERVDATGSSGNFYSVVGATDFARFEGDRIVDRHAPNFTTAGGDSLVETGFAGELMAFVDAVRRNERPESSIESAYRTMSLYEAIAKASHDGVTVELDPVVASA